MIRRLSRWSLGLATGEVSPSAAAARTAGQGLQLGNERIGIPRPKNACLRHEGDLVAKVRGVPELDRDRANIDPAVFRDLLDGAARDADFPDIVRYVNRLVVEADFLQAGGQPQNECGAANPHCQEQPL